MFRLSFYSVVTYLPTPVSFFFVGLKFSIYALLPVLNLVALL